MKTKYLFTLIELIVVIVILSILAAIVIPNVSNFKEESIKTAVESNIRNLQTSTDMYSLSKNQGIPSVGEVSPTNPRPIDFSKLKPEFTRNLPKTPNIKYWVDAQGTVWASEADSPKILSTEANKITWSTVSEAEGYNLYEVTGKKVTSSVNGNYSLKHIEYTTSTQSTKVSSGKIYVVSSIDKNKLESAPAGLDYTGNSQDDSIVLPPEGGTPIENPPSEPAPIEDPNKIVFTNFMLGRHSSYLTDQNNNLYVVGANVGTSEFSGSSALMGIGLSSNEVAPTPVILETFKTEKFSKIYSGNFHRIVKTQDGKFFGWGRNYYGELGLGNNTTQPLPIELPTLSALNIDEIYTNSTFSVAKSIDGKLFTWGRNDYGQLGNGTKTNRNTPYQVAFFDTRPVEDVWVSFSHVIVKTQDGKYYGWGRNDFGQLGLGHRTQQLTPVEIPNLSNKNIKELYMGGQHAFALTQDGKYYGWGYNYYGQLGNGSAGDLLTPTEINILAGKDIVQFKAGGFHNTVITSDKKLYTWGHNNFNLLVIPASEGDKSTPQEVTFFNGDPVVDISVTSFSTMVRTESGKRYAWGSGSYSLGLGSIGTPTEPTRMTLLDN